MVYVHFNVFYFFVQELRDLKQVFHVHMALLFIYLYCLSGRHGDNMVVGFTKVVSWNRTLARCTR